MTTYVSNTVGVESLPRRKQMGSSHDCLVKSKINRNEGLGGRTTIDASTRDINIVLAAAQMSLYSYCVHQQRSVQTECWHRSNSGLYHAIHSRSEESVNLRLIVVVNQTNFPLHLMPVVKRKEDFRLEESKT